MIQLNTDIDIKFPKKERNSAQFTYTELNTSIFHQSHPILLHKENLFYALNGYEVKIIPKFLTTDNVGLFKAARGNYHLEVNKSNY